MYSNKYHKKNRLNMNNKIKFVHNQLTIYMYQGNQKI